jgi:hypothetical protein
MRPSGSFLVGGRLLQPNRERLNAVSTGPLPQNLPHELDALRLKLIAMAGTDLAPEQTEALAVQISAIRLQLKRLAADQQSSEASCRSAPSSTRNRCEVRAAPTEQLLHDHGCLARQACSLFAMWSRFQSK